MMHSTLTLTLAVAVAALHAMQGVESYPGLIGLLTLPQVFGDGPCERFTPAPIPVFERVNGASVGEIRVRTYWTFTDPGSCEGLVVHARLGAHPPAPLPTLEYGYETPAAIVVERQGEWFKLATGHGVGWIRANASNRYYPYDELVRDGLSYLTADWDGELHASPGGRRVSRPALTPETGVDVLDRRRVAGELWLLVQTGRAECAPAPDALPPVIVKGWIRAHGHRRAPAVWFYSRGC